MTNELKVESYPVASSGSSLAVADMQSARMAELRRHVSLEELTIIMRAPAIPERIQLRDAEASTKLNALGNFLQAYLPPTEIVNFVSLIHAAIKRAYQSKQFGNVEFRKFFHGTKDVFESKNGEIPPLPSCLSPHAGIGFVLIGPSNVGRTALLERLRIFLGKPFFVNSESPAPARLWVIPMLYLTYPTCGTLRGLIRDIRSKILEDIPEYDTSATPLRALLGTDAQNSAIAICILLNVGLIVLDGAGARNINRDTSDIFTFLNKLKVSSGIAILVSGTCAFMRVSSFLGTLSSNLFNGPALHLSPIAPPPPAAAGDDATSPGIWRQINAWFWKQGLFGTDCAMPEGLPDWTYEITLGRLGWLAQGFRALHMNLVTKPELSEPGKLNKNYVQRVFNLQLRLHKEAIQAVTSVEVTVKSVSQSTFLKNLDFFTDAILDDPNRRNWLDEYIWARTCKQS